MTTFITIKFAFMEDIIQFFSVILNFSNYSIIQFLTNYYNLKILLYISCMKENITVTKMVFIRSIILITQFI